MIELGLKPRSTLKAHALGSHAHCFGPKRSESPGWETDLTRAMSFFLTQEKDCEPTFFRRKIAVKSNNRAGRRRRGILETSVNRGENGELRGPRWDIFAGTDSHCRRRRPAAALLLHQQSPLCTVPPTASRPRWLSRARGDGCHHQNMPRTLDSVGVRHSPSGTRGQLTTSRFRVKF